ncbi:Mitochondrial-processing peptidase subunit beta [Saitoella coloradoensis]
MASRISSLARVGSNARMTFGMRRFYASAPSFTPKTKTTTLPNGFTVATESSPYAQTATVGVWIDAGSRAENSKNNGTAHFLEHLAFKGTKSRTREQLEKEIEFRGSHLNAYTSREQTVYYAKTFKDDVPAAVDVLADILLNSKLEESAIEQERGVILQESDEVDKQLEEVVFDHLHATAFQQQPLGQTILGPRDNIRKITRDDITSYIKQNYTADRMVLVGAGGVEHDALVQLAEKHFGNLPTSQNATGLGAARGPKPQFVGSEVRVRDDTMPAAHIAIAVEGVSWKHPDYFTMLVMQSIIGNWDRALGNASELGSRLSHMVSKNHLANSYSSFSTSYADTGLWGIYMVSENLTQLDDLIHFTLKEWSRLSTSPTEAEVERAKAQLRGALLLSLDSTTAVAEDIGRQIVTTGRRMTPAEIERHIGQVTVEDVKRVAQEKLWDQDVAMAAIGPIEGILDYNRIRTDMSLNRY